MAICALGYLGVRSGRLDDWADFAEKFLGMQKVDRGPGALSFRMDDRKQRLVVSGGTDAVPGGTDAVPGGTDAVPGGTDAVLGGTDGTDGLAFMGWEVDHKDDLQAYAARLDRAGVAVTLAPSVLADRRFVGEMIYFHDPAGNRIELFTDPMIDNEPFTPGRPHSGFKTGPCGMGHAVLHVKDANSLVPFYRDLLDFKLSDFGLKPIPLYFFHVNGRHHSFALIGSGKAGFHHFMIEFGTLDDVGQGYDLAKLRDDGIAYSLGRHTNDWMTSFYAHTPSGFFVENGWGGRIIDPAAWEPHETDTGPSFWGHERYCLPEEERAKFRKMRLDLAARGRQGPPIVDCPWLYGQLGKTS